MAAPVGRYTLGMAGPGKAVRWEIPAFGGANFATASVRALSAEFEAKDGSLLTIASPAWALSEITASRMVATYIPIGTEFLTLGRLTIRTTLTVDGVPYAYTTQHEVVTKP